MYVHDTLQVFRDRFDDLAIVAERVVRELHPNRMTDFEARVTSDFDEFGTLVNGAAAIAKSAGRAVSARDLAAACRFGLRQIFGIPRIEH